MVSRITYLEVGNIAKTIGESIGSPKKDPLFNTEIRT